jgi:short-subunit dehydrogenase
MAKAAKLRSEEDVVDLQGRRVLITGASRGIGEALARRFAEAGARVALLARNAEALRALADELGGTAHPADLADPGVVAGLLERVEAEGGPVDVLVNNAGVDGGGYFPELDPEEIDRVFQVNLVAPVQLCRQVLPGMLERARGRIVNVSSIAGVAAFPGMVAYASTKAGLSHFTEILALDLRGLPVGTTLVELGPVPTDMLDRIDAYQPSRDSFDRGYRLGLIVDVPRERVADEVVRAVERDRAHVLLPKRAIAYPLLAQLPREIARLTLTGIRHREEN